MKINISEFKTIKQKMRLKQKNIILHINVGIITYTNDILKQINLIINDARFYKRNDIRIKFYKNNTTDIAFIIETINKKKITFKNEKNVVEEILKACK